MNSGDGYKRNKEQREIMPKSFQREKRSVLLNRINDKQFKWCENPNVACVGNVPTEEKERETETISQNYIRMTM